MVNLPRGSGRFAALVPALLDILATGDRRDQEQVLQTFRVFGPEAASAVSAIVAFLDTPLRELAAEALGAIGPAAAPAVPRLVALLEDDSAFSDYVRARIPRALARIGDPVAIPALIAAARDPDGQGPGERAIIALGMFGAAARPALPSLLQLLSDPRCAPATATILGALARIDPAAGPAWDALLGALDAARDPRERAMYAHGLYRLTCGSGGPARPAAQATFARLAADPDPEVARTAALALKVLGRKSKIKRI